MSDEIKKILNQLEIVARKHTIKVYEDGSKIETMPANVVDELRLNNYSSKLLLDYITNLQEENDRLNNIINELEKWVDDYPSEDVWYEHITNKLKELKENNNAKNKR